MKIYARTNDEGEVVAWPVLQPHKDASSFPASAFELVREAVRPAHNDCTQSLVRQPPARVGDMLVQGWGVVDLSVESARSNLKESLADLRWRREVGGITLPDGTMVPTDRHTQSKLTGAVVQVQTSGVTELRWKLDTGFVTLTPVQITAIATAVASHVAACFAAEADVVAAIEAAGTIAELAAIDVAVEFEAAMTGA